MLRKHICESADGISPICMKGYSLPKAFFLINKTGCIHSQDLNKWVSVYKTKLTNLGSVPSIVITIR